MDTSHDMGTEPQGLRVLTTFEVLARRKVSREKLRRDIAAGTFPAPIKDGSKSLFIEQEVNAWMAEQAVRRPVRPVASAEAL